MNSAPCLVLQTGAALRRERRSSADFMGSVLSEYEESREVYYPPVTFPGGKYLHALVNGMPIAADDIVLEYVRRSAFTNSIPSFDRYDDGKGVGIVPESSLSLLAPARLDLKSEHHMYV